MGVLKDGADLAKVEAKCQSNYDTGKLKVKERKKRKSARYNRGSQSFVNGSNENLELKPDDTPTKLASISAKVTQEVKDSEVMEYLLYNQNMHLWHELYLKWMVL